MIALGTSKCIISPPMPLRLCGYGHRKGNFTEISEDIFLKIHYWKTDIRRLILVYADLLWWNPEFIDSIRTYLFETAEIANGEIIFIASHNHSGPGTGNSFIPLLETGDPDYIDFLKQKTIEAIVEAGKNIEPVTIKRYCGICKMNVYRRKRTGSGIRMLPNYSVPADSNVTIFGYYKKSDGKPKGFAVHYPCHPNLSNGDTVHPDYAGITLRMLDSLYSDSISIFLQGCTADLRPNSVLGESFIPCDFSKVLIFADQFFQCCQNILKTEGKPVEEELFVCKKNIRLPLKQALSKEEVLNLVSCEDDIVTRQWAQKAIEKNYRDYETLEIARVDFGSVPLFFFNAEMSQYYAAWVREIYSGGLCVCYADGMIGYICTEEQIFEGGYEPVDSPPYFALCGTYKPETERIVRTALSEPNFYTKE